MKFPSFRFSLRSFIIVAAAVFASTNAYSVDSASKAKQKKSDQKVTTPKQEDPQSLALPLVSFQSISKVAEVGGGLDLKDFTISKDGTTVYAYAYGEKSIVWAPTKSEGLQISQCGRLIRDRDLCIKSGSDGLTVVKVPNGEQVYKLSQDDIDEIVVSPASTYIAVSSAVGGIALFDTYMGTQISRLKTEAGFTRVLFSENEAIVAVNDSTRIAVYDLKGRKEVSVKVVDVTSFAISKMGNLVWATSGFANPQVVFLNSKVASRKFPDQFLSDYEICAFGGFMEADSKVVMKTSLGKVGVWDWKLNKFVEIPTKAENVIVAENTILTVTEDGVMSLWDSGANKLFTFDGAMKLGVMTSDGTHIVVLSKAGSLSLWDVHYN
jgi:WD40 repeat protein